MGIGNILTVVDAYAPDADEADSAYRLLLRLANQHGCHRDHCKWPEPGCARCASADTGAHDADVAYLHQWLAMLGFEPYDARPHTDYVPHGDVNVTYRRPG